MSSVGVIIVNYGTADLVLAGLGATRREAAAHNGSHVYIVDNASPGGDADKLEAATAGMADVTVVAAPRNGGFAYGNNRALEAAEGRGHDAYFMLNPDAYPREGALGRLVETMEAHPDAGIVGARVENEDGSPRSYAFEFPSALGELASTSALGAVQRLTGKVAKPQAVDGPAPCDWVTGAAFLIRREAIEAAGEMDEGFFLYFEEVDWNLAVRRAGFSVLTEPRARVVHYAGAATGLQGGKAVGKPLPTYWYESWRRYFVKNHGPAYAAGAALCYLAGTVLVTVKDTIAGQPRRGGARLGTFARICLLGALRGRA
ncbi:glycosyltransferase family 2 protein [Parvularcula dongshanensis]|uniref:Glycosyltransferase 2-like domain-containing protein n=1 Tax=Parvularcula dongshanensis TaxID=1173995 RepID=A0A840HZZ4_9PROT|nr:glycosyltransferase family 2 protein [Parvularcula dongshanensis]MBB4657997.1 hypothetical protein [Parvularcula dongshanensis]